MRECESVRGETVQERQSSRSVFEQVVAGVSACRCAHVGGFHMTCFMLRVGLNVLFLFHSVCLCVCKRGRWERGVKAGGRELAGQTGRAWPDLLPLPCRP